MKTWPAPNDQGDLPPGLHGARIAEVIEHFGTGTPRREIIARRLQRIHALALATGHLARFVVFGSFATTKPAPNDVDIFLLMDDSFDVRHVSSEARLVFDHSAAQNLLGASVFWIRRMAALGDEAGLLGHWQIKRNGGQRGIVEVIEHD